MQDYLSFLDALSAAGITPKKPLDVVADGKVNRFDIEGRTTGKKHGWYVLHSDGADAWGAFGDWQTGLQSSWTLRQKKDVSPAEWAALQARMEAVRKQAEAEAEAMAAKAKAKAASLWGKGKPVAADHPYIQAKGIRPVGAVQLKQMLLIPLHRAGELVSLQVIQADGSKTFLPGGRTGGAYTMLGQIEAGQPVLICEGWATGCTLHQATGFPVAVAFNAGNLLPVAKALRQQHQEETLILCADDDYQTKGNPGLTKATEAAKAVNGLLAVPEFGEGRLPKQTDFNDLASAAGIGVVRQQIAAVSSTPAPVEPEVHRAKFPMVQRFGSYSYRVDKSGVYFVNDDGDATWVCSLLQVIAKTRDAQSGSWGRLLEWTDDDGVPHRWAMPLNMLEGDSIDVRKELVDQGLDIAAGRKAGDLLAMYIKTWKVEERARCVDRLGWHGDTYMLPDIAVGGDNEQVVFQSKYVTDPGYGVSGTADEWRDKVARLAGGNTRMMFGLSAAFSGPLAYLANEDSGGFHLRGDSSTGKSTAIKIASSVWGHPEKYTRQWAATKNGLEGMAAVHNDNLLALDEISECDPRDVGEAVYMLGNGKGKARANRSGLVRQPATWRTIFLSSGETTLAALMATAGRRMNAGQGVRLADFQSDAESGHGAFDVLHGYKSGAALALALKDGSCQYYGAAGVAWLKWIVQHRESLPDLLTERIDSFVTDVVPAKSCGQVYRVAKRFGLVAVAGGLATEAGITGWKDKEAECAVAACFESWLDGFGGSGKSEERGILLQVRAFFEKHGASRFEDIRATSEQRVPSRVGFFHMDNGVKTFYVLPAVFESEVCEGFDSTRAAKLLLEKGWLSPDSQGKASKTKTLPGLGKTRCYAFTGKMWETEE